MIAQVRGEYQNKGTNPSLDAACAIFHCTKLLRNVEQEATKTRVSLQKIIVGI